ncbi:hypothetical protein [Actinotalea sp. K2]|uniref:hypothetical protein n=1 Tax=Actinotalea sp. K2 TaxID=2939438 RepID=UPI00201822A0|nr:hypothetical protein [Actinotalea sp. K2]MCL3860969.1 hypothetical protein [Actinotalea sp. K2]
MGTTGERGSRRASAALVLALTTALVLSGCGAGDGEVVGGTPTESVTTQDQPLLQVSSSGGYTLFGTDFSTVAQLTVYPDGRAVTHGPQIAIYPPPALPSLQLHTLREADVDALVDLAREARLLADGPDYGSPPVADAPVTSVTLRVDGSTYLHEVDGLGVEGLEDTSLPGVSPQAREAREVLSTFVQDAQELVTAAADGVPYQPGSYAVLVLPVDDVTSDDGAERNGEGNGAAAPPEPTAPDRPTVLPWTVDGVTLADAGQCVLVTGDQARDLEDALADADLLTRFEQDDVVYDVWVRPLLPEEQGCADAQP